MNSGDNRSFNWRVPAVIAAALLLAFPCIWYGFPYYGDDSASNLVLFKQFSRQFWTGELYPRWLQQLNGGLGNPTAYYYPPVAYWITSLFDISFLDHVGWRPLGWSAALAVVASGLVAYLWLEKMISRNAAFIAALVYLVVPYHVYIDLYNRGALAELWTFVWMPAVLWSVDRVIAARRFRVVGLAVSYALLILTHLPTTLIFSLVPLAYSAYIAEGSVRLRSVLTTVAGMTLGAALASIYLLPAMTMQEFIFHTTEGIRDHYYFGNWFLFEALRWSGPFSKYFWVATGVATFAVIAIIVAWVGPLHQLRKKIVFWSVVAAGSFLMMTPLSKPIWELLPTLQKVQFPFRFNTVLTVSATVLAGLAFHNSTKRSRTFLCSSMVLLAGISLYSTADRAYYNYPVHHLDQGVVDYTNRRLQLNRDTNEFRPRWVVSIEQDELEDLLAHIGTSSGQLNKVNVVAGQASTSVSKWFPREIVVNIDSPSGATLNISQFYFPGWAFKLERQEAGGRTQKVDWQAAEPSKPGGLIRVVTPAGRHMLTLQLLKRWPEAAGELISALSLIVLVALFLVGKRLGI